MVEDINNCPFKEGSNGVDIADKMLILFLQAVTSVSKDYLNYNIGITDGKGLIKQHQERVFAYELYHKWSCLLEERNLFDQGWVINAELSKHLDWFYYDDSELEAKRINEGASTDLKFPDLVLHQGQEYQDNNLIVCEIKRGNYVNEDNLYKDIYKLYRLTMGDSASMIPEDGRASLPFKYGVFLSLDKRVEDVTFVKVCEELALSEDSKKKILCVEAFVDENTDKLNLKCRWLADICKNG